MPGTGYRLSFTKEGFAQQNIENIYVGVDATHTQNAQLKIGNASEAVEVNGTGSQVSLNTTDTSVAASLDMLMVHELRSITVRRLQIMHSAQLLPAATAVSFATQFN